ncbi:MAG: hypothetical protein LUP96_07820, partial [Methylococcaceae bacterium]|nr:hypothetical protein [Methylococcaceae bacterium]
MKEIDLDYKEYNDKIHIFPATFWITPQEKIKASVQEIRRELNGRLEELKRENKLVEAQRLEKRTEYDIEMLEESGYCNGIENYSRILERREPGTPPATLLDYFPDDFLVVIDESHVTLPQLRAMYNGDQARKETLIDYGFRLPSARDNRPLTFEEFMRRIPNFIAASATPNEWELSMAGKNVVEQLLRPTGIPDPEVEIHVKCHMLKAAFLLAHLHFINFDRILKGFQGTWKP